MPHQDAAPAEHPGMGAVPHGGGVTFRVWAPHADSVFVMGTFCGWYRHACPLAHEASGYWSATVPKAQVGDEYKFVIQRGGGEWVRNDPYARQMVHSSGNAIVYDAHAFDWQGDAFEIAPASELVLYELHVGTFSPGSPGTLWGAAERLGYLKSLGVNAVELMPLAEFAGDYSWGYNPAYPFAVESAYGGPDALKNFVKDAHYTGLAVFLDVVYNHFGPSDLDLWRFDGWGDGRYGGLYFYNDRRAETPWGLTRPDYGRPEVRQYIRDNALMWLDEFHLDGLRWDGTVFVRRTGFSGGEDLPDGWRLMQDINREVARTGRSAFLIAEDLQGEASLTRPAEGGGAGFHAQWDANFVHPVRKMLISGAAGARALRRVHNAFLHRYDEDAFARVVYTESHDEVANGQARLPQEIHGEDPAGWAAKKRSTLGAALVLTAPGIPMLFQGQELLEDGWFRDTNPLRWERLEEMSGIQALYRDLIALRRNAHGTTRGLTGQGAACIHWGEEAGVLAFHRWAEGGPADSTVAVFNCAAEARSAYPIGLPAAGTWRVRFSSDWEGYDDAFGNHPTPDVHAAPEGYNGQPARGDVSLGPYSAVVLSQDAG